MSKRKLRHPSPLNRWWHRPLIGSALIGAACLTGLMSVASVATATTALSRLTLEELTDRSDLVLHGDVGAVEFEWVPEKGVFTRITIAPRDVLKGERTEDTVTIRMYGGKYGDLQISMDGAPCMQSGEEVVLFLKANGSDTFNVVNLAEGKFSVDTSAPQPQVLERDLTGIAYLDPAFEPTIPVDLDAFKAAIRRAAR